MMKSSLYPLARLALLLALSTTTCLATGALFVRPLNSTQTYTLMSIKNYDATVSIQDQIAVTHVDQTFTNNTSSRVESTFIFPLPEGAVITELIYWFNGQQYMASLREKKEAQQAYDNQVRKYVDPALLQDLGGNLFKLNIAPINAMSDVRFEITYAEILPYEFGAVTYRFPLKTTGLSPSPLDRVSVSVDATTARSFKSFTSPSHGNTAANAITQISPSEYRVSFGDEHFTPDRDLVLKFETRREGIDLNIVTYSPSPADSFGVDSFYALWATPPDSIREPSTPRDIVFTADISSSMEGKRIEQLKEALTAFLEALTPNDRFNIVIFSTNAVAYRADLVGASAEEIASARKFVEGLGAVGLTNIDEALARSLAMSYGDTTANILVFMTDGLPTWGELDLKRIADSAGARNRSHVRLFPFGIGDDISKPLLAELAARNGGYPTYITSDDSIAATVQNYFRRVSQPVLAGLALDYGGLATYDRYPDTLGNLFWGSQVLQFGRYKNSGEYTIALRGAQGNNPVVVTRTADFSTLPGGNRAVARLWAKYKIDYLLNEIHLYGEKKELVDAVIDLSIRYGILSPYTALYSDPTNGGHTTGVEDALIPDRASMPACSPNPFTDATRIRFYLPAGSAARTVVAIYDLAGNLLRTLVDASLAPGAHEVMWDGRDEAGTRLPSGEYICRVSVGRTEMTRKLMLAR
jgi:Ca-activated chloride channel family protein